MAQEGGCFLLLKRKLVRVSNSSQFTSQRKIPWTAVWHRSRKSRVAMKAAMVGVAAMAAVAAVAAMAGADTVEVVMVVATAVVDMTNGSKATESIRYLTLADSHAAQSTEKKGFWLLAVE